MAEDDAFGAPVEAVRNTAPLFMPMPALLVILALVGVWVIWQFVVRPGARRSRQVAIYEAIRHHANLAAAGRVDDAAMLVLRLRDEIRAQVGDLVAGGEMCAVVTGVRKVLANPPKLEALTAAAAAKAQFSRTVTIQESNGAPEAEPGKDKDAKPANGPKSANEELHKLAQDFKKYWDDRPARLRDLEDAQRRLGV